MNKFAQFGVIAIGMAIAQGAVAEQSVSAANPNQLAAVIQDLGYRAKLAVDDIGDPIIYSSVGGTDFSIQFYGCDDDTNDDCKMLLFRVGYDLDDGTNLKAVNTWNENALVGRAYIDAERDPWLEWAVNTLGGVSRESFEDTYDWWEVTVNEFESEIFN